MGVGNFTLGGGVHLEKTDLILLGHVDVICGKVCGFYREFMSVFDRKRIGLSQFLFYCAFLGALRKICEKRLLASLCLSVRMENLGSHWKDFY